MNVDISSISHKKHTDFVLHRKTLPLLNLVKHSTQQTAFIDMQYAKWAFYSWMLSVVYRVLVGEQLYAAWWGWIVPLKTQHVNPPYRLREAH